MSTVIVFCEHQNGLVKKGSLELLSLIKNAGKTATAIAFGSGANEAAKTLASYGAQRVMVCSDAQLNSYNPESYAATLNKILGDVDSDTILASSTVLARDLFPKVAAKWDAAIVSDCTEISLQDMVVRRPMYAGKCTAKVNFHSNKKIVLMRPNQLPVVNPDDSLKAEVINVELPALDLKTIVKEVVKGASEKLDLTEANIIVSGGRGLQDASNFKMLEELADVLGATVGASRAVCDAGWVPHSMQVGQTGKTVAPTLYIAVGISGAIQHLAGMTGSKVIVAINNDAEAPIFQKATYGIVGDAFEVVPKLIEEFKSLLQ